LDKWQFITIVTSARVSGLVSLYVFTRQKWWERKADAYIEVINILLDLSDIYSKAMRLESSVSYIDESVDILFDDFYKKHAEEEKKAYTLISRSLSSNAFLLSENSSAALSELLLGYRYGHPDEDSMCFFGSRYLRYQILLFSVDDCLEKIIWYSKSELGVISPWERIKRKSRIKRRKHTLNQEMIEITEEHYEKQKIKRKTK
jgi:hypothetical protein